MTRRLVLRSAARTDILERFAYLVDQGAAAAAGRFLEAVEAATGRMLETGPAGAERRRTASAPYRAYRRLATA